MVLHLLQWLVKLAQQQAQQQALAHQQALASAPFQAQAFAWYISAEEVRLLCCPNLGRAPFKGSLGFVCLL
jgi:hypothetical protein